MQSPNTNPSRDVKSMLVSIIVPTYNCENYIEQALDSCLLQGHGELELLISDDQSTDTTSLKIQAWLNKYQQKFYRAEFFLQPKNLGVTANTQFLLKHAQGNYVRLLEGDDILVDNSIRRQLEFIQNSPEEIQFLFSDLLIFSDDLNNAVYTSCYKKEFVNADVNRQYEMLLYAQRANGPSVFFHRETILACGGYVGPRNCADWPTVLNLSKQGVKIHYINEGLIYYRRHKNNVSNRKKISWRRTNYEMKKFRNDFLLKETLGWRHRIYCIQDILKTKAKAGYPLNWREKVTKLTAKLLYRSLPRL